MDGSVPGPASQGGDHGDAGDEGKGGHDLPPHPATEAEFWKSWNTNYIQHQAISEMLLLWKSLTSWFALSETECGHFGSYERVSLGCPAQNFVRHCASDVLIGCTILVPVPFLSWVASNNIQWVIKLLTTSLLCLVILLNFLWFNQFFLCQGRRWSESWEQGFFCKTLKNTLSWPTVSSNPLALTIVE